MCVCVCVARCTAVKLQFVYQAKLEDERTIAALRSELVAVAAARDAAIQKEDSAKELITKLLEEVTQLRSQVWTQLKSAICSRAAPRDRCRHRCWVSAVRDRQVGELQSTVAHLVDEPPAHHKRPPLMSGACVSVLLTAIAAKRSVV